MHLIKLRSFSLYAPTPSPLVQSASSPCCLCQSLGMQLSVVMSTRSGTLGVPVFPSDFRILVMVPEGPAALPDAILQMAFVFDSFRFSTWVFSEWSSRFQGNSTGDFHNALFLLSGLATIGLHYS